MHKGLKTLAGMGGFEPPNGGIKIRCLTTWLHPNTGRPKLAQACDASGSNHRRAAHHSQSVCAGQCLRYPSRQTVPSVDVLGVIMGVGLPFWVIGT
jgi:hypothetical protein